MGGKYLSSAALVDEAVAVFGPVHGARVIGWAAIAGALGVTDARSFIARIPIGGESTRYKRLADIRRLAATLREHGYDLDPEADAVLVIERALAPA
jgi:hypothetical protein